MNCSTKAIPSLLTGIGFLAGSSPVLAHVRRTPRQIYEERRSSGQVFEEAAAERLAPSMTIVCATRPKGEAVSSVIASLGEASGL